MTKTNVAVVTNTAVVADMPDFLKNQTSNRGAENITASDLVIPRLELVQSLSPCRKKTDPAYIEGAEEGMLFNNVTRELYGPSVNVVPVYFRKEYIVWKDRKLGGGFLGAYGSMAEAEHIVSVQDDPVNYRINDTANHFCLLIGKNGEAEEIVVSMAVTKLKTSRKWNSLIRMAGGDSFARVYEIGTAVEQNKMGQDYYNLSVKMVGFPSEMIYRRAEHLYSQVQQGRVGVDTTREGENGEHSDHAEY
jgi:hypothetical protein